MDPQPWGGAELAGAWPAAAPVDGNSSRECWELAGVAENLIGSNIWRRGDRMGWATRPNCGGDRSSSAQGLERGGVEMGWGMAMVEYGTASGPFYRAGGWEGRRCGEGNGRRQSVPLIAFKHSVLGGERRGVTPGSEGEEEEIERHSIPCRGGNRRAWGCSGAPAFSHEVAASALREGSRGAGRRRHAGRVGR
jgi:hypothetical protein